MSKQIKTCGCGRLLALALAGCMVAGMAWAQEPVTVVKPRFAACTNASGAGLYWVDTTCGRVWWADPGTMLWVACGAPTGCRKGPAGTYMPFENRSGEGLFVLNTKTGAGWWTDGKAWKALGVPAAGAVPGDVADGGGADE